MPFAVGNAAIFYVKNANFLFFCCSQWQFYWGTKILIMSRNFSVHFDKKELNNKKIIKKLLLEKNSGIRRNTTTHLEVSTISMYMIF